MSKLSLMIGSFVVASCAPEAGPGAEPNREPRQDLETEQRHSTPLLSGAPIWTVSGALHETGHCFGVAVAAGDLDGDGYRDIVVAEGTCVGSPVIQGRIAIFRGGPSLPSTVPVWTDLDWQNPPLGGTQMTLSIADIDGDRRDDLLVRSRAGVQVFSGLRDLSVPLGAPAFRLPFTGNFGAAVLADVNGDGKADIVSTRGGAVTVWQSTPGAASGPFTAARVLPAVVLIGASDTNGDRKADVLVFNGAGSQLWLGCRPHERGCDGGLRATPAWTSPLGALGMVPDLNHDGLSEAILGQLEFLSIGASRISLYLSDRGTGGLAATPAWSMIGDPNYAFFGEGVVALGDLDGDHRSTDIVLPSAGRLYAAFPTSGTLATMRPAFAWPREDSVQDQIESGHPVLSAFVRVAAAGDVDRDRLDDLLVGDPPDLDGRAGHAYLFAGGRVPADDEPAPYLLGTPVCELPASDKPDLTVDAAALARSLQVKHIEFPPDSCIFSEGCVGGPGLRRLLMFDTVFANHGGGAAVVPGPDTAPELYRFNECEGEFELDGFATYELVDAAGGTIATGRKQSVFPADTQPLCINAGPSTDFFPDTGISPGWADVYDGGNACQWLDATGVPDGRYTLRISIDVNHIFDQDDVRPDTVSIDLELAGDHVTVLP